MENQETDFRDYLKIAKRRRRYLFIPVVLISILSVLLAVLLPPVFRSTATILIEEQEIPTDLVRSTVTTFADQRIQVITQRIMTRPNLTSIIQKYNLYPEKRKKDPPEVILEKMRNLIKVDTISADVIARNGTSGQATIAFTLAFDDNSPKLSQQVTNELTTLFLKENIKSRTQSAENATLFLNEEARRLKEKIQNIQTKLAEFKEKNLDLLPEITRLNQQEITALNSRLLNMDGQDRSLQERRFYLQGQLAQIDPNAMATNAVGNRVFDMKDRLKVLESEYPSLVASFATSHPDVIAVKREIDSLKLQIGDNTDLNNLNAELTDKKAELAVLLKKYSDNHPDIQNLQKQVEELQKAMVDAKKTSTLKTSIQPDNPAYITLMSQLESVNTEIKSMKFSRDKIIAKIDNLRKSLRQAPLVEKEYMDLIQEMDNSTLRYREVSARKMEAEISQQLEIERKGERFTLIDPPQEPLEPVSPNRIAILLLGFIFAFAAGIATVVVTEMMASTINSEKTIAKALGVPPLVSIPYLENKQESSIKKRNRLIFYISSLTLFIIAVLVFHFVVMPLNVFWFKLLRVIAP